jgi:hypothetical protein
LTAPEQRQANQAPRGKWRPPPNGWVKLNTDVAFCPRTEATGIGMVARDHSGAVLLTAWRSLRRCGSPEAEACLQGIRLIAEWIREPTWVESECANLIKALEKKSKTRSVWVDILAEIKATSNLLHACSFRHIHRETNLVAHLLSQKATGSQ